MPSSLADARPETPAERLSGISGKPAKASLSPKDPETPLRVIAKETIQVLGKQGSAATDIALSEGRLSAKLSDGTIQIRELERLGPTYAVRFAEEVLRQLGPLATPQARMRAQIRAIRQATDELEQGLEHFA